MKKETKYLKVLFQEKQLEENGTITGYGSIFNNIDLAGDIVRKGAFLNSLSKKRPEEFKMLFGHKANNLPVGVWEEMREDDKGLFIKGSLDLEENQEARSIRSLVKKGGNFGLSIGYRVIKSQPIQIDGKSVTELLELELGEVSIVNFPANEAAGVLDIKSEEKTTTEFEYKSVEEVPVDIKEVEKFLKFKGLSQKESKTIISRIKEISKQRDVADQEAARDEQVKSLTSEIKNLTNHIKKL